MSMAKASDPIGRSAGGRKLIAVVHADMVGYSRLIGLDDVGTLGRLRRLRNTLIDPAIDEHGGRIVNTGGDSLLIVFDSVDGAMRCAMKVQQQLFDRDDDEAPDRAIRFRVGINAGDVIPEGTDVHGDVVNVAARLQAACPPGGFCVSRAMREPAGSGRRSRREVTSAPTPTTVPGARTIRTPDLAALVHQRKPVVLDTNPGAGRPWCSRAAGRRHRQGKR
jgi:class 3 adenylate cyclase